MKTPQEWQNRYWKLRDGKHNIAAADAACNWDTLVRDIQLDAFKEGMLYCLELIAATESAHNDDTNRVYAYLASAGMNELPPRYINKPKPIPTVEGLQKDLKDCLDHLEADTNTPEVRDFIKLMKERY